MSRYQEGPSWRANESVGSFLVVAFNASSTADKFRCEIADTTTSRALGISQYAASTDGSVEIANAGLSRAQCGASVSAGSYLTWQNGTGKVVEAGLMDTITAIVRTIGIALQSGSTDSVIRVDVCRTFVDFA